jgi:hypothetical protein
VPRAELHERVHGHRLARGRDDQRVDVDRQHVVTPDGNVGQSAQHAGQTAAIDRGLAAELAEQPLRGQRVDHLVGVRLGDRGDAELHIGDGFGEDPPDSEHHYRTELRIDGDPGDQLPAARDHRSDEQCHRSVLGCGPAQQRVGRVAHGPGVGEPQPHQPAFGLVGDRRPAQLDCHRVADRLRGVDRRRSINHFELGRKARAQQRLFA